MSLLQILRDARGPLTRADRKRWAQARTLADLGELTAQWLEGRIDSQPGYYGRVDVDEDLAPGLTAALIACNRHGFVTNNSEGGVIVDGPFGPIEQHANVTGVASQGTHDQLRKELHRKGFRSYAWPLKRRWRRALQPPGDFGFVQLDRGDIETTYDGVSNEALDALCDALQVTVYDPRPGRNTLWRELERAARRWSR